jgi:heme-degrading monooxygenase HmoA
MIANPLESAYRTKITELIHKNINLRRDVDGFIKSERTKTETIATLQDELRSVREWNSNQASAIYRLLEEKKEVEKQRDEILDDFEQCNMECYREITKLKEDLKLARLVSYHSASLHP